MKLKEKWPQTEAERKAFCEKAMQKSEEAPF